MISHADYPSEKDTVPMLISFVVPCYNEEESLPLFYDEACRDDGSGDKTLEKLRALHAKDERVHYISFSRNFGKEAGLYAGLKAAKGDYVATLDADLQDPPSLIPEMLQFLLENKDYDCVATRRKTRKGEPPIRSFFRKDVLSNHQQNVWNGNRRRST